MKAQILIHLNVTLHAGDDAETAQDVADIINEAIASDEAASALDLAMVLVEEVDS